MAVVVAALATGCGSGDQPRADDESRGRRAPVHYVALGDSYTAAPGTGRIVGSPEGCGRSDNNYPRLVAARVGAESFTDASCGGATTEHLTQPQQTSDGTNPPQLAALTPDTTLVTVGIGGNDVGLVELAGQCAEVATHGGACEESVAIGDRVANTVPAVASVVAAIREKAPDARVLVVGYPTILPNDPAACADVLPHSPTDLAALREGLELLNHVLEQQANAHGAEFVDTTSATAEHHLCAPEGERWIEGLESVTGAAPLHPTAEGERAIADAVLAAIRGS
ncbi:SGNH/GDSL hydrolase family protein [Saccharomonospora glauca]|uniref:GDSL-like Lipase/Acylhydrolase n=1 Tax=Saccharomonospora glauca K62 TaxID=928724 RepID=I1CXF2_9PSEU|nr:SGNH/GDSL hydrolase family protein [Saccharomonospora glauca]EIE97376.1 GDSL-like Lipase/Acylhydrolase [Saccharomonospora glauca K62]